MEKFILMPPVVFVLVLAFCAILSYLTSFLSFTKKGKGSSGVPYACGEDTYDAYAQPNYSQFFPFAFFFTIAHVATLILVTVPFATVGIVVVSSIYILAVVIGLFILIWRD